MAKHEAGLLERLAAGPVLCAEGYLFELERRGYLQAGPFVPEVVLEHPEVVRQLHRDFVHAGSDVVLAFTYYGHREKLKIIGKEAVLEPLNRQALAIAKEVAEESGCLLAGNLSNTNIYDPDGPGHAPADPGGVRGAGRLGRGRRRRLRDRRDAGLAGRGADGARGDPGGGPAGGDHDGDPSRAADARGPRPSARRHGGLSRRARRSSASTASAGPRPCCRCSARSGRRSPARSRRCRCPIGPPPTRRASSICAIRGCGCIPEGRPFPTALEPFMCNRYEMAEFAKDAQAAGVGYIGICCGAGPHHVRAMAEALGRTAARQPLRARHDAPLVLRQRCEDPATLQGDGGGAVAMAEIDWLVTLTRRGPRRSRKARARRS